MRRPTSPAQSSFTDLSSGSSYEYSVECSNKNEEVAPQQVESDTDSAAGKGTGGSFTTAPKQDEEAAVTFVWVADLAGQGWGRNPDFELTTVDGDLVKGGYAVFQVMEGLKPNFAVFQGDMIYADNAISPTKDIPEEVGGGECVHSSTLFHPSVHQHDPTNE